MTELLPCPFCGGEAHVEQIVYNGYYYVSCSTPTCCDTAFSDTEAEAIQAWNTRVQRTCKNVDDEFPFFKCSECGCNAVVGYGSSGDGLPNYCPNCGARVVG